MGLGTCVINKGAPPGHPGDNAGAEVPFKIIKHMQHEVWYKYPEAVKHLPKDIYFITSQELEDLYPDNTLRNGKT